MKGFKGVITAALLLLICVQNGKPAGLDPANTDLGTSSATFSWNDSGVIYTVALSSVSDFSINIATGSLSAASTSYVNLSSNTAYYFKVKVSTLGDSDYETISTVTYAAAPSNPAFLSNFFTAPSSASATITINWDTNGNPVYTDYIIEVSSEPLPNSNPGNFTLAEPYPPVTVAGLKANTTYHLQVRAENLNGIPTSFTSDISTSTLAHKLIFTDIEIYETSGTTRWIPLTGPSQEESCEGYQGILSTSPIFNPPWGGIWTTSDNTTSSVSALFLPRNTTFYLKIGALNWSNAVNYSNVFAVTTLSSKPQNFSLISVSSTSAMAGWNAFPQTPTENSCDGYILEASSDAFSTIISSSSYSLPNSTLTLTDLMTNTTYYFRVGALNQANTPNYASLVASATLSLPLTKDLVSVTSSSSAIQADFYPLPTSPPEYSCEGYIFQASTSPFTAPGIIYFSSTPSAGDSSLTISELWPNTSYYLRIGTINTAKIPNYIDLGIKTTAVGDPLPSVTLTDVWLSSAAVSFQSLSCDGYVVQASTYKYFNYISSENSTANSMATSLYVGGLEANTKYYFRAGPIYNGTTVYTLSSPLSKATLSQKVSSPNIWNVFYSSITVSWTSLPSSPQSASCEGYIFEVSTDSLFSLYYSSQTSLVSANSLSIESLSPNTTYYLRVGSINIENFPNYASIPSTATHANIPIQTDFTGLTTGDMQVNWDSNSNPPDTLYVAEISSYSNFSSGVLSSSTYNNFVSFSGLSPNTTYYPRVRSVNRFNISEPFIYFSSMATLAFNPVFAAYSELGISSITLNWGAGSNPPPPNTLYIAEISSTAFSDSILSSTTRNTSTYFSGLIPNTSYYLQVSAYNHTMVATPPTSLGTALTYPTTPYALGPDETFTDYMIDGFTVNWASNGNSSFTVYNVEISTKSDFSVLTASASTLNTYVTFSELTIATTYWARTQSEGLSGIKTDFVNLSSAATLLSAEGNILYTADSTVSLETSYGTISVFAPAGAFGGSLRLSITPESDFSPPTCAVATLKETGIGIKIECRPKISMLKPLTITVPYKLSDIPTSIDRSRLILARYDENGKIWVPLPSVSETSNNLVRAETRHLSTFQIMEITPSNSIDSIKIYPNPYTPSSQLSLMNFAVPSYSTIKIYTFNGELVKKLKADANGTAHWNGSNANGRKVASGVYIALIEAPGKKRKIFKIAIER